MKQSQGDLAKRRDLLLAEAELHRAVIGLEYEKLRSRLASLQAARERMSSSSTWLIAGGTIASLMALRHRHRLAGWLSPMLTAWRWVQSLRGR